MSEFSGLYIFENIIQLKAHGILHHKNLAIHDLFVTEASITNIVENSSFIYGLQGKAHKFIYLCFLSSDFGSTLLKSEKESYESQIQNLNAQGFLLFCSLLNDGIESYIHHLSLTSADEYQLEGYLKSFQIETHSLLLHSRLEEISQSFNTKQLQELNRLLAIQFISLSNIKMGIEKILQLRPKLQGLYENVVLLHAILYGHFVKKDEKHLTYCLLYEKIMGLTPILLGDEKKMSDIISYWQSLK